MPTVKAHPVVEGAEVTPLLKTDAEGNLVTTEAEPQPLGDLPLDKALVALG